MPGRAVHLDCELHLLVGGIQHEHVAPDGDAPLLDEWRHAGRAENLKASPDLEFALASVCQERDELEKRSPSPQAGSSFHLVDELTRWTQATAHACDRGGTHICA